MPNGSVPLHAPESGSSRSRFRLAGDRSLPAIVDSGWAIATFKRAEGAGRQCSPTGREDSERSERIPALFRGVLVIKGRYRSHCRRDHLVRLQPSEETVKPV
jgi:hypothetical protein